MRVVKVPLGGRSYPIYIGPGAINRLPSECVRQGLGRRGIIISDTQVGPLFGRNIQSLLKKAKFETALITVPSGEKSKDMKMVQFCYGELAAHRLERNSFVIALGGGVVGDLAGFVAATYLRGIPFVQIPTTLLAQVDSSVGGKVGVNLKAGKNLVGAFHQPRAVFCDLDTLAPLPEREFRAGLAEVIKYGIIYDAALFKRLERGLEKILAREPEILGPVIARCCQIKAEVVGQDETESGLRAILNFGHTIGHALEAVSGYGQFLHGEAISIGQVAAAQISTALLRLPEEDANRITTLFHRAGLPTAIRLPASRRKKLLDAMRLDKKVIGGELRFVLAQRIGHVLWGRKVPEANILDALDSA